VTIQDRGPYVNGRIIDLSPHTAGKLDMQPEGVASVQVTPLPAGSAAPARPAPLQEMGQRQPR
jgi:rare lipoprotein A